MRKGASDRRHSQFPNLFPRPSLSRVVNSASNSRVVDNGDGKEGAAGISHRVDKERGVGRGGSIDSFSLAGRIISLMYGHFHFFALVLTPKTIHKLARSSVKWLRQYVEPWENLRVWRSAQAKQSLCALHTIFFWGQKLEFRLHFPAFLSHPTQDYMPLSCVKQKCCCTSNNLPTQSYRGIAGPKKGSLPFA